MQEAAQLFDSFKAEAQKDIVNRQECDSLLVKLKLFLARNELLFPSYTPENADNLLFARSVLEEAALLSLKLGDVDQFDRQYFQIKPFYEETRLAESSQHCLLLGLYLMGLLAKNDVSEFHLQLELIPYEQQDSNQFISLPVSLERYMTEGSYSKVFDAQQSLPHPGYSVFLRKMTDTIRDEISSFFGVAYSALSVVEALKLLNLPNTAEGRKELSRLASNSASEWYVAEDVLKFTREEESQESIASLPTISQALHYGKELERII
eukprot:GCRY01003012.1.p1 GENE.GCRY01003012.1~~GCRY01003012.1.p1  ORF type:complete len:265 (+),score=49.47 GCRY01003012.1:209-1003(+)